MSSRVKNLYIVVITSLFCSIRNLDIIAINSFLRKLRLTYKHEYGELKLARFNIFSLK